MSNTVYVLRKKDGDILECDRCCSPAPTVEHRWDDIVRREPIDPARAPMELLCMFCYETHFGTILKYAHHRENHDISRAMCQSLNLIMKALKP